MDPEAPMDNEDSAIQQATPRVLFSADQIAAKIQNLAQEIAAKLGDPNKRNRGFPVAIPILHGSFVFAADLLRALHGHGVDADVDFITLESYGAGTAPSGDVRLTVDLKAPVEGKTVLLIDDILDTGRTLRFASELLKARGAVEILTCVLLAKPVVSPTPNGTETTGSADFVGFECPDVFVIGYGLDLGGRFRHLPFIGTFEA